MVSQELAMTAFDNIAIAVWQQPPQCSALQVQAGELLSKTNGKDRCILLKLSSISQLEELGT